MPTTLSGSTQTGMKRFLTLREAFGNAPAQNDMDRPRGVAILSTATDHIRIVSQYARSRIEPMRSVFSFCLSRAKGGNAAHR